MKNEDIYSIHSTSFSIKTLKKEIGKSLCFNESHVEILLIHIELMVFHN